MFFTEKNGKIYIDKPYIIEFLVPVFYEEKEMYKYVGDTVYVFGVGVIRTYLNKTNWEKGIINTEFPLTVPNMMVTKPSISDKIDTKLVGYDGTVCRSVYFPDDQFLVNVEVMVHSDNLTILWDILDSGKLNYIDYFTGLGLIYTDGFIKNEINRSAEISSICAIYAHKYRKKSDPSLPFRLTKDIMKDEFITVNSREIVAQGPTIGILSYEDTNTGLMVANNKHRKGKKEEMTPVEKVIFGVYEEKK